VTKKKLTAVWCSQCVFTKFSSSSQSVLKDVYNSITFYLISFAQSWMHRQIVCVSMTIPFRILYKNLCRCFMAWRIIAQGGTDGWTNGWPLQPPPTPTWLCWKILLTLISGGRTVIYLGCSDPHPKPRINFNNGQFFFST